MPPILPPGTANCNVPRRLHVPARVPILHRNHAFGLRLKSRNPFPAWRIAMSRFFLLAVLLVSSTAQGAEQIVWQIGKPDHSYAEFAIAGKFNEFAARFGAKPIVFDVGRSDPAKDWPYIQPGPMDRAWAPSGGSPWTIRFQLPEQPRGFFRLRIDFVDTQSTWPPQYVVALGGHQGVFRLTPGENEASLADPHAGTPQGLEMVLPASYFRQGSNEIHLTCSDGSWVQHDAITLWNDPEGKLPPAEIRSFTAQATPFFVRREGQLCRLIDVNRRARRRRRRSCRCRRKGRAGRRRSSRSSSFPLSGSTIAGDRRARFARTDGREGHRDARAARPRRRPSASCRSGSGGSTSPPARTPTSATPTSSRNVPSGTTRTSTRPSNCCHRFPDFRWNLEVAWQAENYVHSRSGQKLADFYRFAQGGRLGIQALYCNMLTGLCSPEEACRFTWFAHKLCREHGIPYESAMISDVPSQEASLPMILAGSGIRYFSSGINNDRAYTFTADAEPVSLLVGRPRRQPRADDVHVPIRPGRAVGTDRQLGYRPGDLPSPSCGSTRAATIIPTTPFSCTAA